MKQALIQAFIESLAVGDAFGKNTEYCSITEIEEKLGEVYELLPPQRALAHQDLFYGQVTDDTEQNVYLIRQYGQDGAITPQNTAACLLRWVRENDLVTKYMGPSSTLALSRIEAGEDVTLTGLSGTTCGGIMRIPSAFLFSSQADLVENVVACLLPTHNTATAMEAAMAYAFALDSAATGGDPEAICDAACQGADLGRRYGNQVRTAAVVPSCTARIRYLQKVLPHIHSGAELKHFLYDILGATCTSYDVCSSVIGIFLWAKKDVYLAIRLATELGGDTDTIGCLTAALCCIYAGGHNLPASMVEVVGKTNGLDFASLAALVKSHERDDC